MDDKRNTMETQSEIKTMVENIPLFKTYTEDGVMPNGVFRAFAHASRKWLNNAWISQSGEVGYFDEETQTLERGLENIDIDFATPFRDYEGKRIFVGDILEYNAALFLVHYNYSEDAIVPIPIKNGGDGPSLGFMCCSDTTTHRPVIIGNIHDNPELLEDDEDNEKKRRTKIGRNKMNIRKLHGPFLIAKNKKTGEVYEDIQIYPKHGFLVMNDNDAMTEIGDTDADYEWYVCEDDLEEPITKKELKNV